MATLASTGAGDGEWTVRRGVCANHIERARRPMHGLCTPVGRARRGPGAIDAAVSRCAVMHACGYRYYVVLPVKSPTRVGKVGARTGPAAIDGKDA